MNKDLTIIIVTFNSSEVIERCLSRLNAEKYDVVVVDNTSSDNTTQIVSEKFPQVKLIHSGGNLGYGRANNIGLRQAKTEFALILNPDAFILEESTEIALQVLKNNPQIALASPEIFHTADAEATIIPKSDDYRVTNFIIGGVLFMRLEVFRKIGFFDEDFFMFAEDNELSDRSIKNGYQNVILNNAKAFHSGAGSSKKSLRTTYRRFWHLGWSKSKYKQNKKGRFHTIRATARLSLIYFCEGIFYFLVGNLNKSVSKFAFSSGCFSFLIGLKAFKKDGTPRG
ncbi:MAG: glycosyltransferase family 2 protein [Pseudomonadota bacterium]